jgi:hypothetical protein
MVLQHPNFIADEVVAELNKVMVKISFLKSYAISYHVYIYIYDIYVLIMISLLKSLTMMRGVHAVCWCAGA